MYSNQKYSGYQAKLTCGHGRRIKYGSYEDQNLIQYGWALCNKCGVTTAVVGWKPRAEVITGPSNGDKVAPGAYSGWIAPNGDFHYVGSAQHYSTALKMGSSLDEMEESGWCHFSYTGIHFGARRSMTEAQRSALWDSLQAFEELEAKGTPVTYQRDYLRYLRDLFPKVETYVEPAFNPEDIWA